MSFVEQLAYNMKKSESEVMSFLSNAPQKYKVYTIPKRKHGHRVIAHPCKELKQYQRVFNETLGLALPINPVATAYVKGKSIKDNALVHSKQRYLLKMDLENFFNSINPELLFSVWDTTDSPQLSEVDKAWLSKLLFWCPSRKKSGKLVLSVGAPSSPLVSNFCMSKFDELVTNICTEDAVYYTRYADDLTFSTNRRNVLFEIPSKIKAFLSNCFGRRLTINHSKTVFSSKAHNRHVTGITITNDGRLSLGRERKRYIKHLINQYKYGDLNSEDLGFLKGLVSFASHVEPSFICSLKIKYSDELIQSIIGAGDE